MRNRKVSMVSWIVVSLCENVVVDGFLSECIHRSNHGMNHNNIVRQDVPLSSSHYCWMRHPRDDNDDDCGGRNNLDRNGDRIVMDRRRMGIWTASAVSSVLLWLPPAAHAIRNGMETSWVLRDEVEFPLLALNTVGLSVEDTERALELAVQEGIRHVDFHPGKERDGVARYLSKHPPPSSSLFLTTKIRKAPPGTSPEEAAIQTRRQIEEDLSALHVHQVDMLMLRDSPDPAVIQAQWKVLEEALLETKQTRSLGIINFCPSAMEALMATAKVLPDVHYYLLHVGMGPDAHGLRSYGESRGIRTFAYGAVGEPGPNSDILQHPILQQIASSKSKQRQRQTKPATTTTQNVTTEQVAVKWLLQSGTAVSVRPTLDFALGQSFCSANNDKCSNGIQSRASLLVSSNDNNKDHHYPSFYLTTKEMKQLNALTYPDDNPTLFSSSGCPNAFVMPK